MNILDRPQYGFLKTDPRLGKNIIFLTYGGSYAYGTNTEGSDIDIRGCTLNSKADLLGMGDFEQVVDDHTDTTVYGFNKLLSPLINCNPNTIELLGCKPEYYFVLTPIGKQLIDQHRLFLSRRAINSFGGYAGQQLRRLENALVHDAYPAEAKERHIKGSCENAMHLIRLYLMCLDILEREEIVTFREKGHDLLIDIRNGRYQRADHTFNTDFYDLLNELERRLNYAAKHTSLPESPDMTGIEAFQVEVNERVVWGEI